MATHNPDIKSDWVDPETVKVSWVDVKLRERTVGNQTGFAVAIIGGLILGAFLAISAGSVLLFFVFLFSPIIGATIYARNYEEPNSVTIGKAETRHRGQTFPTEKITRFEMGKEGALEGGVSTKPFLGNADGAGQTIIRLWLDDTRAHNLTKNNWQSQVNHEIHGALTKALEAVRDLDRQQEHKEKFGVVDDSGMPDY